MKNEFWIVLSPWSQFPRVARAAANTLKGPRRGLIPPEEGRGRPEELKRSPPRLQAPDQVTCLPFKGRETQARHEHGNGSASTRLVYVTSHRNKLGVPEDEQWNKRCWPERFTRQNSPCWVHSCTVQPQTELWRTHWTSHNFFVLPRYAQNGQWGALGLSVDQTLQQHIAQSLFKTVASLHLIRLRHTVPTRERETLLLKQRALCTQPGSQPCSERFDWCLTHRQVTAGQITVIAC